MSLDKQHEQMADKIVDRIQDLVEEAAPARRVKKEKPNLKPSIYSLRLEELKEWLTEHGEKAFRAAQIFEWLYVKRVKTYDEMTNIPKGLREKLEAEFALTTLSTIVKQESKDVRLSSYSNYKMATRLKQY